MLLAPQLELRWLSHLLRTRLPDLYSDEISLTPSRGLFGTPIGGELVKHGYFALSAWSGAMLLAGGVVITLSRLSQDRSLLARV
jgi:hypothetical protein